jgi:hypothetical protein
MFVAKWAALNDRSVLRLVQQTVIGVYTYINFYGYTNKCLALGPFILRLICFNAPYLFTRLLNLRPLIYSVTSFGCFTGTEFRIFSGIVFLICAYFSGTRLGHTAMLWCTGTVLLKDYWQAVQGLFCWRTADRQYRDCYVEGLLTGSTGTVMLKDYWQAVQGLLCWRTTDRLYRDCYVEGLLTGSTGTFMLKDYWQAVQGLFCWRTTDRQYRDCSVEELLTGSTGTVMLKDYWQAVQHCSVCPSPHPYQPSVSHSLIFCGCRSLLLESKADWA